MTFVRFLGVAAVLSLGLTLARAADPTPAPANEPVSYYKQVRPLFALHCQGCHQPAKPLGGYGDGGALFTDDDERAARLRALRNHGKGPDRPDTEHVGLNSRLDSIQAAVLLEKFRLFPGEIPARQEKADRYSEGLASVVEVPRLMAGTSSVWAQYTIVTGRRDELAKACREAGVPTAIHYAKALNCLAPYRQVPTSPTGLRQAEWLAERVISLPMHPYLSDEAQDLIIAMVCQALTSRKAGVAHAAE